MLPNPSVCGYLPFFCPRRAKMHRECILLISFNWAITLKVCGVYYGKKKRNLTLKLISIGMSCIILKWFSEKLKSLHVGFLSSRISYRSTES